MEATTKRITDMINSKKVFLVMKGTPHFPQCGFSKRVADLLTSLNVDFGYFNIFDDPEFTLEIKKWANWPTTPQLYINGKLIGGCDITMQLHQQGKLQELLSA